MIDPVKSETASQELQDSIIPLVEPSIQSKGTSSLDQPDLNLANIGRKYNFESLTATIADTQTERSWNPFSLARFVLSWIKGEDLSPRVKAASILRDLAQKAPDDFPEETMKVIIAEIRDYWNSVP